jgi:hypothetical protein
MTSTLPPGGMQATGRPNTSRIYRPITLTPKPVTAYSVGGEM